MTPADLYDLRRDPTFNELKNAFTGHGKLEEQRLEAIRSIVYGASRFNAGATAFSKEQSKSINNYKFPWEKGFTGRNQPLSNEQVIPIFELLTRIPSN